MPCGKGLSADAASDLDLIQGMAVAVSMIDAHCGTIGKVLYEKNIYLSHM